MLRVERLRVQYRNGAVGVSDISFSVGAGQVVALFGPNGAGKTTSVRAVSGFLKSEGTRVRGLVELDGTNVAGREPHVTSQLGVGSVPERDRVFSSLTVAENLHALGRLPPKRSRADAFDRVYQLFPMLAERRRELAGRLSGGQQQMLALARGLLLEPRLLIVDEMTLGLHVSVQEPLFATVAEVARQGTAVLLVDESTALALDVADYCYLLRDGRTTVSGRSDMFRGTEILAAGYVEAVE
ncbi:ABC transporter ATP-binding protein [Streptomyces sp. NPDC001276]|uniref:ABC transporter ATP-binding protein n=1 Tax=Streptomyces sp. NPDC001276 TaxID=3364555 RepID=UPI00367649FE